MMGASLDQIPGWSADLRWAAEIGEAAWTLSNIDRECVHRIKRSFTLETQ